MEYTVAYKRDKILNSGIDVYKRGYDDGQQDGYQYGEEVGNRDGRDEGYEAATWMEIRIDGE